MTDVVLPPIPLRVPLTGQDGLLAPTWVKWFTLLNARVGGAAASSLGDTSEGDSSFMSLGEPMGAFTAAIAQVLGVQPVAEQAILVVDLESQIAALTEEVTLLRTQINDLMQGVRL